MMKAWEKYFKSMVAEKNHAGLVQLSGSLDRKSEFSERNYLQYISSLYALGLKERGSEATREAINRFPDDLSLRIRGAENAMATSDWNAATSLWQYILKSFEHYPEGVYWRLALAFANLHKFEEAKSLVREIKERYGESQRLSDLISQIESQEAKKYVVDVRVKSKGYKCHLDKALDNKRIGKSKDFVDYRLRGWIKVPEGKKSRLIIDNNQDGIKYLGFNVKRTDVKHHFANQSDYGVDVNCGFDYAIDLTHGAYVGVCIEDEEEWLLQLDLQSLMNVLEGKENWLFLDNDANESVSQYTGRLLLTDDTTSQWSGFLDALIKYRKKFNLHYFIASSKEAVLHDFYPYARGAVNVFDQVDELLEAKGIFGASITKALSKEPGTYYQTDTHWSDYGAYIAYLSIMKRAGFEEVEEDITFDEIEVVGDLGSKLQPIRKSMKKVHQYKGAKPTYEFYNGISGTGSIEVWKNSNAHYAKTTLLFGDSFLESGCLANYFSYSFERVVVIKLPGSLIDEVLHQESPDLVVVQTNDRYLLTPGRVYQSLDTYDSPIFRKVASLSKKEKEHIMESMSLATNENFYKKKMLKIMDTLIGK